MGRGKFSYSAKESMRVRRPQECEELIEGFRIDGPLYQTCREDRFYFGSKDERRRLAIFAFDERVVERLDAHAVASDR